MNYYKVTDKNLKSAIESRNCVQYKLGEFVSAPIIGGEESRLFVFNSLRQAELFIINITWRIFECEVVDPTPIFNMSLNGVDDYLFWQSFNNKLDLREYYSLIGNGHFAAKEVKLLKELKINENKKP